MLLAAAERLVQPTAISTGLVYALSLMVMGMAGPNAAMIGLAAYGYSVMKPGTLLRLLRPVLVVAATLTWLGWMPAGLVDLLAATGAANAAG
jgi:hypothetical protein